MSRISIANDTNPMMNSLTTFGEASQDSTFIDLGAPKQKVKF
jgi:hypothetical protein